MRELSMRAMGEYERSIVEGYQFARARLNAGPMPVKQRRTFGPPVRYIPRKPPLKFSIIDEEPMIVEPEFACLSSAEIIAQVAHKHGLRVAEVKGDTRTVPIVAARQEAYWRLREERQLSWAQIGKLLGGKDHTTVLHGYRMHTKKRLEAMQSTVSTSSSVGADTRFDRAQHG